MKHEAPAPARAARVFISYARADRPRIAPLAQALKQAGHEVWWDAMIAGGAAFAHRIEEQLDAANAVVVAWSKLSVKSDWVRDEAGQAREAAKLVPISLDGAQPPLGFRQYHVVDLSHWKGDAAAPEFQALLAGIRGGPAKASAPSRARTLLSRRAVLTGTGAAGVAALAAIGVLRSRRASAADNSIAVLPFRNLSGDPAQNYFSDGLAEEVRAALTRNRSLRVAASTSSNLFRDVPDRQAVGARLRVAHLLEGSVRKAGDVVRISAGLVDVATGFTSWSQEFEKKLSDVFAIQSEIASTVADALAVRFAQPRDLPGGTRNPEAYDAYLRGRALFNADEGEASDRAALALFESAVSLDPSYAAAEAARSRTLAGIATQHANADALKTMYNQAIAAARRAVALAPGLAASQLALGYALFTGHLDFRGAREPFERAAALGAGDADTLVLYGLYASKAGRAAIASEAVQRAVQLDRLNPRAWRAVASAAYAGGRYGDVMPPALRSLSLNPKISNAHAMIGNALFALGRFDKARAAYQAEPNRSFRLAGLAIVGRKLGDDKGAQQARADLLSEFGDSALYQQAEIAAQWGDREAALAALEKAHFVGDSGLLYMPTDPMLQSLRGDTRYARLIKMMGLA